MKLILTSITAVGLALILAMPASATRTVLVRDPDGSLKVCVFSSGITSPPQSRCVPYREPPLPWRVKLDDRGLR